MSGTTKNNKLNNAAVHVPINGTEAMEGCVYYIDY